jgi:hypothetical protein
LGPRKAPVEAGQEGVGLALAEADAVAEAEPLGAADPDPLGVADTLGAADPDPDPDEPALGIAPEAPNEAVGWLTAFSPRASLTVATSVAKVWLSETRVWESALTSVNEAAAPACVSAPTYVDESSSRACTWVVAGAQSFANPRSLIQPAVAVLRSR